MARNLAVPHLAMNLVEETASASPLCAFVPFVVLNLGNDGSRRDAMTPVKTAFKRAGATPAATRSC